MSCKFKQFLHTPDSSGKPLSEAKSLERIAGKRFKEKVREGKKGEERGREGNHHFVINLSDQSRCDQIFDKRNYEVQFRINSI
jgi:hypothetical protein